MDFRPDLIPRIQRLQVHARRDALSAMLTGNWMSKIRGRGIEFTGYRQYTSGDDAGMIDWRASMRSRKLLVKELNEEKSLNIFILLDVSDTMLFGTSDKLKAEYAAELVSSLSFAALRSGENVGLAMWSDKIKRYTSMAQGLPGHAVISKAVSTIGYYGGQKNFPHVATRLLSLINVAGLIIIISDFVGYDETWDRYLKIMAQKHELLCLVVRDQRDRRLPTSGEYLLQDPSSGEKIVIDSSDYSKPFQEYVQQEELRLRTVLNRSKADMLLLETTEEYTRPLTHFFLMHNKKVRDA